ncbi:MAG: hypothetical protein U9Q38_02500, partial [Thermodesulfobacteriota bacterium]|nr:hypothetical protein [Thermodesulfobacteriota bacterium]
LGHTLGSEVIVNGTFDTDTTGWAIYNSTIASVGGELEITLTGDYGRAYQPNLSFEAGEQYLFSGNRVGGTTIGGVTFQLYDGLTYIYSIGNTTAPFLHKKLVTATTTSSAGLVRIGTISNDNGKTILADDISLKKLTWVTQSLFIFDYSDSTWDTIDKADFTDITYRIELGTYGYYFLLNTTHVQNDVDLLNLNPELIIDLVVEGDLTTGLSFGASDVELYQFDKLSGKVIQCLSVPLGTNKNTNSTFETDVNGWKESNSTITWDASKRGLVDIIGIGGNVSYPMAMTNGTLYLHEVDIEIGTFTGTTLNVVTASGTLGTADITNGKISIFGRETTDSSLIGLKLQRATADLGTFYIDNVKTREATAHEATNFGATQFTNPDHKNSGIPLTMWKRDTTGRITAKADDYLAEFNGDGNYFDTGFVPTLGEVLVVEIVIYLDDEAGYRLSGLYDQTYSQNVFIGQSGSGVGFRIANVANNKAVATINRLALLAIKMDGANSKAYIDGVDSGEDFTGVVTTHQTLKSLYIGDNNYGTKRPVTSPIGRTRILTGTLAQNYDASTAYAKAKLIYPTLP